MSNTNVKQQITQLSQSENYYYLGQAEPIFKDYFKEVSFVINEGNENSFNILDLAEMGEIYKTISYSNVQSIEIDNIIVTLHLANGEIYFLYEVREDISEILKDFDNNCMITKYKKCIIDNEVRYKTEYYTYIEDFEVFPNAKDNTVKIKGEDSTYILDYGEIFSIEEKYDGDHRIIYIYLDMNENEFITIESL